MNTKRIICGLIDLRISADYPITPKSSRKYPIIIPKTSNIGVYGMPTFLFTSLKRAPHSKPKNIKNTAKGPDSSWPSECSEC
jgi:hypothetical protein